LCGLVGIYGDIGRNEKIAMHWLLHFDVVRGEHSTGVCAVHEDKGVYTTAVYKELGRPEEMYDAYEEVFKDDIYQPLNPIALIGHNRYATQGGITKETAHPFEFENLIGAHNGTIWPYSLRPLNGHGKWEIDSQIIYQHISDTGSVQDVWDKADGAMALTWWDKTDNVLKIARNKERPLYWTTSKDQRTVFWASQPWMLEAALNKAHIKHEKVQSFPTDTVFTISLNNKREVCAEKEKLNPFVKVAGFTGYTGGNGGYQYQQTPFGKTSWFSLKEYVREGPDKHHGYFMGWIEGDKTNEIILSIDSPVDAIQRSRYERIMEFWEERNKKKLQAMFSFYEDDLEVDSSYWKIEEWCVTKLYKDPTEKKEVPANTINIDGNIFDKKQFDFDYKDGCCLCGTCITFEEAKTSLFIKDNLICKTCKDEPFVQEWLAMDQGKVA
jgi:hypothetical protein